MKKETSIFDKWNLTDIYSVIENINPNEGSSSKERDFLMDITRSGKIGLIHPVANIEAQILLDFVFTNFRNIVVGLAGSSFKATRIINEHLRDMSLNAIKEVRKSNAGQKIDQNFLQKIKKFMGIEYEISNELISKENTNLNEAKPVSYYFDRELKKIILTFKEDDEQSIKVTTRQADLLQYIKEIEEEDGKRFIKISNDDIVDKIGGDKNKALKFIQNHANGLNKDLKAKISIEDFLYYTSEYTQINKDNFES